MKARADILVDLVSWFDMVTDPLQPTHDRCFRFQLTHQSDRGAEPLCPASLCVNAEALDSVGPDAMKAKILRIAEYFLSTAETIAERHKRSQEFRIQGYHDADRGAEATTQKIFDVVRKAGADPHADTEGPDERGQTSQLQRHAERLITSLDTREREKNRATEKALDFMEGIASEMRQEARDLRIEMRQLAVDMMAALDRKRESEVSHARGMLRVGVESQGYQALFGTFLPMLMDRFGVGPAGQMFQDLMKNPAAAEAFMGVYPDLPDDLKAKIQGAMGVYIPHLVKEESTTNGKPAEPVNGTKVGEVSGADIGVHVKEDAPSAPPTAG